MANCRRCGAQLPLISGMFCSPGTGCRVNTGPNKSKLSTYFCVTCGLTPVAKFGYICGHCVNSQKAPTFICDRCGTVHPGTPNKLYHHNGLDENVCVACYSSATNSGSFCLYCRLPMPIGTVASVCSNCQLSRGGGARCLNCNAPIVLNAFGNSSKHCADCIATVKAQQAQATKPCMICGIQYPFKYFPPVCPQCLQQQRQAQASQICMKCGIHYPNLMAGMCPSCYQAAVQQLSQRKQAQAPQICIKCGIHYPFLTAGMCPSCYQAAKVMGGQTAQQRSQQSPAAWWMSSKPSSQAAPNQGANIVSCKLSWNVDAQAYQMTTPFKPEFVELLKKLVPFNDRLWDPATKMWTVSENYYDALKTLLEKYFGGVDVVTKAEAEHIAQQAEAARSASRSAMVRSVLSPEESAIVSFFKLLPYDAVKTAYRKAQLELHPDKNGGDANKSTELNVMWDRIQELCFGAKTAGKL